VGRTNTEKIKKQSTRKLDEDYFEDWKAGTELGREGFKQIMLIELQRCTFHSKSLIFTRSLSSLTPLIPFPSFR
jgi:hypothetical protein